jgi:hypothetical protein
MRVGHACPPVMHVYVHLQRSVSLLKVSMQVNQACQLTSRKQQAVPEKFSAGCLSYAAQLGVQIVAQMAWYTQRRRRLCRRATTV